MHRERRRLLTPDVATWEQMKAVMRNHFVPQFYSNDKLRQRFEHMRQVLMRKEEGAKIRGEVHQAPKSVVLAPMFSLLRHHRRQHQLEFQQLQRGVILNLLLSCLITYLYKNLNLKLYHMLGLVMTQLSMNLI